MPQQKRRRWRRKGMCCVPAPRPCIDSMPRRCMPHCAICPPCPSANPIAPSSSSHSECSCEEEKFCTIDSCKNAPQCITAKLRYCPYGFKDKSGTDLGPDEARSKEMFEYQPTQEREMGAQYPQAISTPYKAPQDQPGVLPAPEFVPSGYPSVPTISSIQSRAPDQFDQSISQYAQQFPADAAQPSIMQQDYGPTEFQPQIQGRITPISPESQPQMQSRMLPRPDTLPSPMSVSSGPNIQIRKAADQYQPYYSQPQDAMPSYDYPATRQPIPVSQEEGYFNIPRAGKQGGGYSAQYSLGPAPEDTVYPSGLPPPQFDGQNYSLSSASSADRMKPRSVIQDEPRRMPQYTSPSEYVSLESVPTSQRGKHGLIHDTRVQQPVSETSYVRYVSEPQTSPAPAERIPGSRPVSMEGFVRPMCRPPYQADTTTGVPYQADYIRGVPYQADISRGVPYQADTSMRVPYQVDASRGVPYQADASRGVPYQADISVGTPNQVNARVWTPYQADIRAGAPYQPGIRTGASFQAGARVGAPFQADTRMGHQPNMLAEPVIKKSTYDTQLPGSPSAPEINSARSATMDRTRSGYQPMPGGYESTIESPPSSRSCPCPRYPLGRPLAESTSIASSRNVPMDYSSGSPLSLATSVRTTERQSSDGLHKISFRGPSTGYNKFCKEPPQPECVDKCVGFEYPLPQTEVCTPEEKPPKCSCRYPPAFKHLECAGLMSGTCECNENDS